MKQLNLQLLLGTLRLLRHIPNIIHTYQPHITHITKPLPTLHPPILHNYFYEAIINLFDDEQKIRQFGSQLALQVSVLTSSMYS